MSEVPKDPRAFFRWIHRLVLESDDRVTPMGPVDEALSRSAGDLATSVRRSFWHMTFAPTWHEVRTARPLQLAATRPGIDHRYLTSPRSIERLPLLSSHHVGMRLAHTIGPLLVVDGATLFVGAPRGEDAAGSVWVSTVPHVVGAATACFETVWQDSWPAVPAGSDPPFTRRMVEIGFLLTDGASDREIARALHLSERTISAEVAEIVRRLGARNRAHAIALITTGSY